MVPLRVLQLSLGVVMTKIGTNLGVTSPLYIYITNHHLALAKVEVSTPGQVERYIQTLYSSAWY